MYDPKGGDDDTITALFNTLHMVWHCGVNALP